MASNKIYSVTVMFKEKRERGEWYCTDYEVEARTKKEAEEKARALAAQRRYFDSRREEIIIYSMHTKEITQS